MNERSGSRLAQARTAIVAIMRTRRLGRNGLAAAFNAIMAESARALAVERVGLWDIEDGRLTCRALWQAGVESPTRSLHVESAPAYVRALESLDAVAIDDVHDDPRAVDLAAYTAAHRIGALIDVAILSDGRLRSVICHEHIGAPRQWTQDERTFVVAVGALISLALETEHRVREEHVRIGIEARYQHLVESLPCVVYSFEFKTGRLSYISPNAVALGGWTAEQWMRDGTAKEWLRRIAPEDRPSVEARFDPSIAATAPGELTYQVDLPDGSRRWVRDACVIVRDPVGAPIAVQGTLTDVSDARRAELSVIAQQQRFESLFANVDLLGVVVDAEGRILQINRACARSLGRAPELLVGAPWNRVALPPAERATAPRVPSGRVIGRLQCPHGEIRLVDWTHTALRGADGELVSVASLGVDISARAEVEAAVMRDARFETLGRVSALVAHDLGYLVKVLGVTIDQLETANRVPAEELDPLRQICARTRAMTQLMRRAQAGGGDPVEVSSTDLVTAADAIWRLMARGRARLRIELVDPVPLVVDADAVTHLLTNLVGNALDATPASGEVTVTVSRVELDPEEAASHGAERGGRYAILSVTDNGSGMSPTVQARAFEPFFTTKRDGSGLGLASARGIVQRHDGFLTIDSAPLRGTVIRIYLPAAEVVGGRGARPDLSGTTDQAS